MKAPISWLKKYTKISLPLKDLMWRITEVGLTCETYEKVGDEIVLDIEVTPNRPDWLSIMGIAREISIIENGKLKDLNVPEIPKKTTNLPITVSVQKNLVGRYSGITIEGVTVDDSPNWIKKQIINMGLRPINNLVDITNFVMYELGIPIHVFDYDKLLSHKLSTKLSKGGENFKSVDDASYRLPKNTLIIKDVNDRVIDLCGLKGGANTGISRSTKNIFIHVPIYSPVLIRKTSQKMKLASDASYIYERGPNTNLVPLTLKRAVELVVKIAGGNVSSDIIDFDSKSKKADKITISLSKINKVLGVDIDKKKVINILTKLGFEPTNGRDAIVTTIPDHRSDISIEEDIVEEIARIYGYNNFPKTLLSGSPSRDEIPYKYNRKFELDLKDIVKGLNFSEVNTLALTSKESIENSGLDPKDNIRIANPVSLEYEYLRSSLIPSLLSAAKLNTQVEKIKIFEFNKTYKKPLINASEPYKLTLLLKGYDYSITKGVLETILIKLGIDKVDIDEVSENYSLWHVSKSASIKKGNKILGHIGEIDPLVLNNYSIKNAIVAIELDVNTLRDLHTQKSFKKLPKYPAQIEDLTLVIPTNTEIGKIVKTVINTSKRITKFELTEIYKDSYTFRIWYQDPKKTLSNDEVGKIRKKILKNLKTKFGITLK